MNTCWYRLPFVLFLALVPALVAHAQSTDRIEPRNNPDPARWRKVWQQRETTDFHYLLTIGRCPDFDGDGIREFSVGTLWYNDSGKLTDGEYVYRGGPKLSNSPMFLIEGLSIRTWGDFRGDGDTCLVMERKITDTVAGTEPGALDDFSIFSLHHYGAHGIDSLPIATLDSRRYTPRVGLVSASCHAVDLDHDGADELIIVGYRVYRGGAYEGAAEIWIYHGGPDFNLESPGMILRDDRDNNNPSYSYVIVDRWDADSLPDIALGNRYDQDTAITCKFWLSGLEPWTQWRTAHRQIDGISLRDEYYADDFDGDGLLDIAFSATDASDGRVRLYRSGAKGPLPFRSLAVDSSDATYSHEGSELRVFVAGYAGDSAHRYASLGIWDYAPNRKEPRDIWFFAGGPNGPDRFYDAAWPGIIFNTAYPLGDVTGDGWDDMAVIEPLAIPITKCSVYAGGPYIPDDVTAVGLREVGAEGKSDAVSAWPNPVRDVLHIAWRGDLPRTPSRIVVHDLLGRTVEAGAVDRRTGQIVWHCDGVPPGVYVVGLYGLDGRHIASMRVVKE